ncbi:MAG: DHA2 family efflux MFS transporter permease subunit [Sphingomonadales bacterium]|nr:MAG: DHA2 family efflux MFS transporter permease subunit [Sphingomonadales bacterium]
MEEGIPVTPTASAGTAYGDYPEPGRRALITLGVVLTTLMTSIDGTIANTVLPQIRGSVSASDDEILWVLTSFILASTIVTPAIGWLERTLGRRNLLLFALVGFTVASVLCGIATGIVELVFYRVLQGATAAVFIPLSQAILLDINPPKDHARAMSLWGMGAVLGPIIGPILGGWLTDQLNWRWVFFINIPIAIVGFLIMAATLPKRVSRDKHKFDGFGFIVLVSGLIGLQLVLDRGPSAEWFSSSEIWIYLAISAIGFWLFFVHIFTSERPIIHPSILTDRNYLLGSGMILLIGVLMFAGMALLPTLMQGLLGYPVLTAGLTQASRGVGTFVSMFLVGRLMGKIDSRMLILIGISLTGLSYWQMSQFSLDMDQTPIIISGLFQGLGLGLVFVPLMGIAFTTIQPALRTEAASFYTLIRNIGSSLGISVVGVLQIYNSKVAASTMAEHVTPDNLNLATDMPGVDLSTAAGQAMMSGMIHRQSALIAYIDSFHMLFLMCVAIIPLLFLLRTKRASNV